MKIISEINLEKYLGKYSGVDFTRVYKFTDVVENYADACAYAKVNKAYTGIETLDNNLYGIEPAEVCLIISPPNIGKTALIQHSARYNCLCNDMTKEKILLWFSTETSEKHLLERELQREFNMHSWELQEEFINHREDMTKIARDKLKKFENLRLVVGRINIDKIKEYAMAVSDEAGIPIGCIMIDYAQRVRGNKRNEYENISEVADKVGDCAIGLNVPLIITSQTSRQNVKDNTIDMFSGKGSGELENCGQIVITMQKVKNEDLTITDPVIHERWTNEEIYIHQMKIEKKKRGKFLKDPLIMVQDAKTLELFEYEKYKHR